MVIKAPTARRVAHRCDDGRARGGGRAMGARRKGGPTSHRAGEGEPEVEQGKGNSSRQQWGPGRVDGRRMEVGKEATGGERDGQMW